MLELRGLHRLQVGPIDLQVAPGTCVAMQVRSGLNAFNTGLALVETRYVALAQVAAASRATDERHRLRLDRTMARDD